MTAPATSVWMTVELLAHIVGRTPDGVRARWPAQEPLTSRQYDVVVAWEDGHVDDGWRRLYMPSEDEALIAAWVRDYSQNRPRLPERRPR